MNTRQNGEGPGSSDYLLALRDELQRGTAAETVDVADLTVANTPRMNGEDAEHASTLAESTATLPPILVHRPTMRVIDGVHRLRAAALRGHDRIDVRFFDGSEEDANLLAVAINVAHGKPLSIQDRAAAARRIFTSHPSWSNRAVAAVAGLSPTKVSSIRADLAGDVPEGSRVGRDGRSRPLNAAQGRELARELLQENPDASMRQIAKQAGISAATVADVRDRMRRGEEVLPLRQSATAVVTSRVRPPSAAATASPRPTARAPRPTRTPEELAKIVETLRRDPSIRHNEPGRALLRMLGACATFTQEHDEIASALPNHCRGQLSELLEGYAKTWQDFAEDLRRTTAAAFAVTH